MVNAVAFEALEHPRRGANVILPARCEHKPAGPAVGFSGATPDQSRFNAFRKFRCVQTPTGPLHGVQWGRMDLASGDPFRLGEGRVGAEKQQQRAAKQADRNDRPQ